MTLSYSRRIAVLIATANRPQLLVNRALSSIESQTLSPRRVVVVDDSNNDRTAHTENVVREWQPVDTKVNFLQNRRTKGASGAWNTGLDHLLRICDSPEHLFVALLDDDDHWESDHLEHCMTIAERDKLDIVATPFLREEECNDTRVINPPGSIETSSFLVGNPGIQSSNLVCKLSVFLEAGLFDESLSSCTDRDLIIRVSDLPDIRYGTGQHPTVQHYACDSRSRLSTPGSVPKIDGLDGFFRKYRSRMTVSEREKFRNRARKLFQWEESQTNQSGLNTREEIVSSRYQNQNIQDLSGLVVGLIADTERIEDLRDLLADLQDLDQGLLGLDVLVLENGAKRYSDKSLRTLVESIRSEGLRIHFIDRKRHLKDIENGLVIDGGASKGDRLSIAHARTVLQSYLYAFAKTRPNAVIWIIDDDMRLDPLVVGEGGRIERRRQEFASVSQTLRSLHANEQIDIAIGSYTGAPPLPFASTVRVQLVDLIASLQWLAKQVPTKYLPDRSDDNAVQRLNRRDYYYDLSRNETDRLETPFWITPEFSGETVGEAFNRLAFRAERILAGEQVFRPLANLPQPLVPTEDGLHRGGNTFVLDIETLRLAPNPSPSIEGRLTRRSDMLWALLQRQYFNKQVKAIPIGCYHDRSRVPINSLDAERLVDDIRGYAMFSAIQDSPGIIECDENGGLSLNENEIKEVVSRVGKYLKERFSAFRLSFYRVRGLTQVLQQLMDDKSAWWTQDEYRSAVKQLQNFAEHLDDCYRMEILQRIESEIKVLDRCHVREFLEHMPREIEEHRRRLSDVSLLISGFETERIANAQAIAKKLAGISSPLRVLGLGMEGVVLTDDKKVFKVFDNWKSKDALSAFKFLRSQVGRWNDANSLYPILEILEDGHHKVLVYPYEPSEPYTGGNGPGIAELLAECRLYGIVCRNFHPDNLRVIGSRVKLIDYGSDIYPLEEEHEYTKMCQRAWLSYRWSYRADLKEIMREVVKGVEVPELDGFDRFHEAILRMSGQHERSEDIVLGLVGQAQRVVDYGCGNGWLSFELANKGMEVFGYDPDSTHQSRWSSICDGMNNLTFAQDRNEVPTMTPFDLVICRRVLCTIESDIEVHAILVDLRKFVSENGRVIVTVCDPNFTFGGPSPECERELPPNTEYEETFVWRKTVRETGRVRHDVHRPERVWRRAFASAGLAVCRRVEMPTIDLERFEPMSDQLAFELRPLPPIANEVTLLIKACAMEADTIDVQVRHLVSQLEAPRAFAERILVIDPRAERFLRQYTSGNLEKLRQEAHRLKKLGWLDRVIEGPVDDETVAVLNQRWFGIPTSETHASTGAQLTSTLFGFEACQTRYVLHVDADVMIGRLSHDHDYLADMVSIMQSDSKLITVALNIATDRDRPYSDSGAYGAWRVGSRVGMIDLTRLTTVCPLPNRLIGSQMALPWHRALDGAIEQGAGTSRRGGDRRTFHVHPKNSCKGDTGSWLAVLDRIEHGFVPNVQNNEVDWVGSLSEWMKPVRHEPFVFAISGRNVEPSRFRRCIESVARQKDTRWGAILFDDASDPRFAEHFEIACTLLGNRCTVIRNRRRQGSLVNLVTAVRLVCTDPETVIVTLDADDALIGDDVLKRLATEYERGADVTVGSMLRTDKAVNYPVCFQQPRQRRGGNIWQHLRSFRKRLFDAIPDEALKLDDEYIDIANDWAFMLPIVEMAEFPVHIAEPLYLHEPSGVGKGDDQVNREVVIGRIVTEQPSVFRFNGGWDGGAPRDGTIGKLDCQR